MPGEAVSGLEEPELADLSLLDEHLDVGTDAVHWGSKIEWAWVRVALGQLIGLFWFVIALAFGWKFEVPLVSETLCLFSAAAWFFDKP